MPHALLLSPDDQAVSAITGVLEEMSVTCERPLNGVSAAQKLSSQSFDLVLVDCENLPAAKLIFDVCRRGKDGSNPVPIAIVDGRAGLPTAFRLGAELILTKPVAKDQARTTIRTAVGRVRKDAPADESATAPLANAATKDVQGFEVKTDVPLQPRAAAFSATPTAAAAAPARAVPVQSAAIDEISAPALEIKAPEVKDAQPKRPFVPSDDPVLAEIEQTEMAAEQAPPEKSEATTPNLPAPAASPKTSQEDRTQKQTKSQPDGEMFAPVFSSYQQRQKPRGALVALFGLVLVAGAFYGLWTYQPGFREIAQPLVQTYIQPQIDRALALAGIAKPAPSEPQAVATPVKPPAPPVAAAPVATAPAPETVDGAASSPAPDSTTNSTTNATATASSPAAPSASPAATTAQSVPAPSTSNPPTAPATNTATAATPNNKSVATKPDTTKTLEAKKDTTVTSASETPLPGESSAIILSSKGAEKRLAHSVAPKFPASARSASADATIVLKEVVDATGKVEGVRLVEGDSTLAAAAMKAVKQWRYRPYLRDGKALPFQTVVIIDLQH